jgi:DNA polymerase III gamma/tau subunit
MKLECELARVQMKRYLGGEELPPELMSGLETHVKSCKSCKQHLDDQRLKLANQLAGAKAPSLWNRLQEKLPKPEPKDPNVFAPPSPLHGALNPKTLVLSCCLAVVLFAMSAVAKNPSMIFGPKASASLAPGKEVAAKGHGDEGHGKSSEHEEEGESHGEASHSDNSHSDDSHSEPADSHAAEGHEGDSHKEHEASPSNDTQASDSAHSEPKDEEPKHEESKHEEPKKEEAPSGESKKEETKPEAKKPEPSKTLLVADEGRKPRIKPAPRPRPRAAQPVRRAKPASRKPAPRRQASAPKAPKKNSIRVYDANGNPIR